VNDTRSAGDGPVAPVAVQPTALRALPVQLTETEEGVIMKRGVTTLSINGEGAADFVRELLERADKGLTRGELRESFAEDDRDVVDELVDRLFERGILVPEGSATALDDPAYRLDAFYWNFGARAAEVADRIDAAHVTVLGVNEVSRRVVAALSAGGAAAVEVVDYHVLRNVTLFDDDGRLLAEQWPGREHEPRPYADWVDTVEAEAPRCIVATSDFGINPAIREWNKVCVKQGWNFLPVLLHDLVGYIGPLVAPGETACYECLRARENSHMDDPAAQRAPEASAFESQRFFGFHPSLATVVGDLAALELLKFYGGVPLWRVGTLIEVHLMTPSIVVRRVLKVPRCSVCSTMRRQTSSTLNTSLDYAGD
jgi:bacteriocin biosynthesis cyclodehydratase domain-containing protein